MKKLIACLFGLMLSISSAFADLDPCRNLFDKDGSLLTGTYNANTGQWVDNSMFRTLKNIPASPNTTYTLSATNTQTSGSNAFSLQAWDSQNHWLGTVALDTAGNSGENVVITGTTPADTVYLSVSFVPEKRDINTIQLELGSTATAYTPYDASCNNACPNGGILQTYTSATGTVSQSPAPTPSAPVTPTFYQQGNIVLRKVGSYADSYDASTGIITRRVGYFVTDGSTFGYRENLSGDGFDIFYQ